jgi:uncharacterized protein with HEPN domain
MLSDSDKDALEDIRENIVRAMQFVEGLDLQQFLVDLKSIYAATRSLEIISEASRRLSPSFKERFPETPWDIAGSGNIYRHNYESVLERRVWRRFTTRCRRSSKLLIPNWENKGPGEFAASDLLVESLHSTRQAALG